MVNGQRTTVNRLCPFFFRYRGVGGVGDFGSWELGLGIRCLSLSKAKVRHFDRLSDLAQSLLRAMSNELWAKCS